MVIYEESRKGSMKADNAIPSMHVAEPRGANPQKKELKNESSTTSFRNQTSNPSTFDMLDVLVQR